MSVKVLVVESELDEANHHLIPGLRSPAHGFGGVGIGAVVWRVVEVGDAVEAAAGGSFEWDSELVPVLPAKVVTRHREDRGGSPAGNGEGAEEVLASDMHVRHQAGEVRIGIEAISGTDLVVRISRGDFE